ncbi:hypothetical protein PILCRDRAFT_93228 [Piloderma croceum F 1598]|uniref:Uncharacterized protein n=1 Tax=Piloderma croceum (strain F 1598) TaxID=765440 RepID=A0A0C3EYJ3_PILCF|nr:hypothetical protein PILCRDRAFT_93228 [Piloderma croceum F 1598]
MPHRSVTPPPPYQPNPPPVPTGNTGSISMPVVPDLDSVPVHLSSTASEMEIKTYNPLDMPLPAQSDVTCDDVVIRDVCLSTSVGLDASATPIEVAPPIPLKPFEVLLWVVHALKKVAGPGQKTKLQKQEPMSFGPLQLNTVSLANKVESAPPNLVISSLEWRFMKPANSPWMPLHSAVAYTSLVKQMASAKTPNVIVHMDLPKAPVMVSLSWASANAPGPSDPVTDEYKGSDDDCESHHKKPWFDDELEELVHQIDVKYSAGILHIQNGKATLATIPIVSNLFNAQHTAKKVSKTAPATPCSTSALSDGQSTGPSTPSRPPVHNASPFTHAIHPYQPPAFLYYGFPPAPHFGAGFGYPGMAPPPQPSAAHCSIKGRASSSRI